MSSAKYEVFYRQTSLGTPRDLREIRPRIVIELGDNTERLWTIDEAVRFAGELNGAIAEALKANAKAKVW